MPSRNQIGLVIAAWAAALALPGAAFAGTDPDTVAGNRARIRGVSQQSATFGERLRVDDYLDITFGSRTFRANAISGGYVQQGKKLHFRVDPERLRAFEASWERAFLSHLEGDGVAPESVACAMSEAKVKGRLRNGEIKLTSSYRLTCFAEGDFPRIDAKARVRFRGRGPLEASQSAPGRLPGVAGLMWNFQMIAVALEARVPESALLGSAGGHIEIQRLPGLAVESLSPGSAGFELRTREVLGREQELLALPRE